MRLPVLVFDFGNVVAYFDYRRFYDRLGARLGRSGESVRTQLRDAGFGKLHAPFETGLISPAAFAESVTDGLGISLPFEDFVRDFEDIFWLNEPVSRLIASLDSRGYTLILGSNTNCAARSILPSTICRDARSIRCACSLSRGGLHEAGRSVL